VTLHLPHFAALPIAAALTLGLVTGVPAPTSSAVDELPVSAVAAGAPAAAVAKPVAKPGKRLPMVDLRVAGPIPNEEKVTGRMIMRKGSRVLYAGWMGIEIRGQASARFPKKSWSVELRDRSGDSRDAALLGMPADDDWALVANYADKSLMRNALAYHTARWVGGYAARTRFVEVRLNGRYQGVYSLVEKLKLHEDRIDARDRGRLVEWTTDPQARKKGGADFRLPVTRIPILLEDPEAGDLPKRGVREVRRSLGAADRALHRPNWTDPAHGWRKHVRPDTAVDFLLLNEFLKNHDGMSNSVYLTRLGAGRWTMGPIWDFDHSMGNINRGPGGVVDGFMLDNRHWSNRFYADRAFAQAFAERWRELRARGLAESMDADIDRWAAELRTSGAAGRNFDRWRILGTALPTEPASAADRKTYGSEVRALKDWLRTRIAWMDAHVDDL
jgi:hypothetical protein